MQQIIQNIEIRGLACAVPARRETEADLAEEFGEKNARRLVKGTQVRERRTDPRFCTSDLCASAAEALLAAGLVDRESIRYVVFVTQSADYLIPASSCVLQDRLGLPVECAAFDVNQGCAGYPYGLWIASRLLQPSESALVLVGDTSSRFCSRGDRSTLPLFGDAGSATLLSHSEEAKPMGFAAGTDGGGHANVIVEGGHFRDAADRARENPEGGPRDPELRHGRLTMNGAEVFSFALERVPELVESCLSQVGWTLDDCGDVVLHQANGFMLQTLIDKLELPPERVPLSIGNFGNTSSASIPLTLVTERGASLRGDPRRYLLGGFGVGWSWAGLALETGGLCVPELIELS